MENLYIVGGADDLEMRTMEIELDKLGLSMHYAMKGDRRVMPWEAYKEADAIEVPDGMQLVLIECHPAGAENFIRIDHHNPGDPGYNKTYEDYWDASSLGQLCNLLDIAPTHELRVKAAYDAFPAQAMDNLIDGISPQEILDLKKQDLANRLNVSVDLVHVRMLEMSTLAKSMPEVIIAGHPVRDFRSLLFEVSGDLSMASLAIDALYCKYAIFYRQKTSKVNQEELGIQGNAYPETIKFFKETWAPEHKAIPDTIYGVETRGYAGAKFDISQKEKYLQ